MTQIEKIEKTGTASVKRFCIRKLKSGYPFMINSNDLPGNQCYLGFPDESISLVTIIKPSRDFTVIKKLSQIEGNSIRVKYNLP